MAPQGQLVAQVVVVLLLGFLVVRQGLRRGWRVAMPGVGWLALIVVLLAASNAGPLFGEPASTVLRAAGLATIFLVALLVLQGRFRA